MQEILAINIVNLGKRFGSLDAVKGISLEIRQGEIFGLLGPNGAGKTTTISMLSTLLSPSYGDALTFGKSIIREAKEVRRIVGVVPQDLSLYPTLSGEENLAFFGQIYGIRGKDLRERIRHLLDLVGLTARKDDPVLTYSGGMKRRLNLICSLINEPRLLMLDEPTVGVDPQTRENIFEAIQALKERGMTILYTTHYMEEAERLCDRIAIMDEGKIIALGTLTELLEIVGMGEVIQLTGVGPGLNGMGLNTVPGVTSIEVLNGVTRVCVKSAARALSPLANLLAENDREVTGLEIFPVNLERVFIHLTGKALRD